MREFHLYSGDRGSHATSAENTPSPARVLGLVTFTTGLKQMIFFEGGPFQLRLSIPRINSRVKWWGCRRRGHGDKGPVLACPGTNIKHSCIVFAVTSIALILGLLRPEMLGHFAQSLIGSTGTLSPAKVCIAFHSGLNKVSLSI